MSRDFGALPILLYLPIKRLYVDHSYQRNVESERSRRLVRKIAENFQWTRFGSVLVTETERGFAILDGQHRTEGARLAGISEVPCVIVEAPSFADQAKAFVGANMDRVTVNSYALHHALVSTRDPHHTLIHFVCEKSGASIPKYPVPLNKVKPGETLAIAAIGRLIRSPGVDGAVQVMSMLVKAYAKQPGSLRAPIILATGSLLIAGTTPTDLAAALSKRSAAEVEIMARTWCAGSGLPLHVGVAEVLKSILTGSDLKMGARPRPKEDVLADYQKREMAKPLPGVQRRCACNAVFTASTVGEDKCPKCRTKK